VLEQIQSELGSYVEQNALEAHDSWEQLVEGCVAFVRFATLTENKRILLLDGPNVVEWKEWRSQDEANSFFDLREQLEIVSKEGKLFVIGLYMGAHKSSGALNELSLCRG
ncbi:TetR/AcrR family transcriptional regulator, partial [Streptococcus gordonii]|nr:TetR/AcrR family transcriptional regulator [Streptococcus gordonii]